MAPPITKASDGSQLPNRSRKPCTLPGSVMPERMRPRPNSRPTMKAESFCMAASSDQVTDDEHGDEARAHEGQRGDQRTRRQAREPTHAVAAGAARAVACADAHQQTGQHHQAEAGVDAWRAEEALGREQR